MPSILHVVKRNGKSQNVMFDKITSRISKLCYKLDMNFVDPAAITIKVVGCLYPGISTSEVDNLTAETAASMFSVHSDYAVLAARIAISNLHKETDKSFSKVIETITTAKRNAAKLDSCIVHDRDHLLTYWGFRALESSYLININGKNVESPQHMFLRISLAIHIDDVDAAIQTYDQMSQQFFIHSSNTAYNAGKPTAPTTGSYVMTMQEDSIVGIYNTLAHCAEVMKDGGAIGLAIHCIRSKGSPIVGTNGESTGIVPMLRVYNSTIKRPGAICIYIEPWHPDIFHYIGLKRNYGAEELRARDLSYALWIPDLFMERVASDADWTLMCPRSCQGLDMVYGHEFRELYEHYEREGKGRKVIKAQQLWYMIVEAQIETGSPMMVYKDACNVKSNQANIGVIQSSSLYGECMQVSQPDKISASNAASLVLWKFVVPQNLTASEANCTKRFDFEMLASRTRDMVDNLNKLIDNNSGFGLEEVTSTVNRNRPVSIGVQGLADTFALLRYPFESKAAQDLNREIFECIYYAATKRSCELAKKHGQYETFLGSPLSNGLFQFDLWGVKPSSSWNWTGLREDVKQYGTRNSVLISISPTGLTSKVLDGSPSVEPYESITVKGKLSSGCQFCVINSHLVNELKENECWNEDIKSCILNGDGSLQNIAGISEEVKQIYKTGWEISQRVILDLAADRAPFIDQSQSLIMRIKEPDYAKISSMHFYGWKKGLKTGMTRLDTLSRS